MRPVVYFLGFRAHHYQLGPGPLYQRDHRGLQKDLPGVQIGILSILPTVYGILFLLTTSATVDPWLLIIFTVITFCEAALAIAGPKKLCSQFLNWYFEKVPDQTQRLFGIIGIIFGTTILTWIK